MTICWFCKQDIIRSSWLIVVLHKEIASEHPGNALLISATKPYFGKKEVHIPCCIECKKAYKEKTIYKFMGEIITIGAGIGGGLLLSKWFSVTVSVILGIAIFLIASGLYKTLMLNLKLSSHKDVIDKASIYKYPDLVTAIHSGWKEIAEIK